jgi:hypothetical protein
MAKYDLISKVQDELKKHSYNDKERKKLKRAIYHLKQGYIELAALSLFDVVKMRLSLLRNPKHY